MLTETVRLAHVILPGASPYEKEGTYTNDRGRVQRIREAIPPPGTSKPDWEILSLVGTVIQAGRFEYDDPSKIMTEIAEKIPAFKGMNYENIGMLGADTAA